VAYKAMSTVLLCFLATAHAFAQDSTYGNRLASISVDMSRHLAERNMPAADGSLGRNREKYFHVRFQMGLHHLADYGISAKNPEAIDNFVKSVEYSFRHQQKSGDFTLVIPESIPGKPVPTTGDLASGVAFFASSLGSGWLAIESSDWVRTSDACKRSRDKLETLKPQLGLTLRYLLAHREILARVDSHAPNRLLLDALAFDTLGKLLDDAAAAEAASSFVSSAAKQTHEQGYFIEGGGFDSSYNGVAAAVAFRLVLAGYDNNDLANLVRRAIQWRKTRILPDGKISTDGNSRVNPGGNGESFLGRKKDVDVAHTIEAFTLAAAYFDDPAHEATAKRIFDHYRANRR